MWTGSGVAQFLLMAVMGVVVYFEVWFLFGLLSFRMERIFGAVAVTWLARRPGYLPIQYVYYVPLASLLGQPGGLTTTSLLLILAWVAALSLAIQVLWPQAVRTYEAPGG